MLKGHTELQPVAIVSLQLSDEAQFPRDVQRVMQAEGSGQLTDAQMPLEGFGVLWEGETILALLSQGNRFTEPVDKLNIKDGGMFYNPALHSYAGGTRNRSYLDVLVRS